MVTESSPLLQGGGKGKREIGGMAGEYLFQSRVNEWNSCHGEGALMIKPTGHVSVPYLLFSVCYLQLISFLFCR